MMPLQNTDEDVLRVLLVEDNVDHAYLIRMALEECWEGAVLHHADSVAAATKYLSDSSEPLADLILLDLKMPGVSGLDLLAVLKMHGAWRKIPVVVLTTSLLREDRTLAYDYHANSFVMKPINVAGFRGLARDLHHYWNKLNQPSGHKRMRMYSQESRPLPDHRETRGHGEGPVDTSKG